MNIAMFAWEALEGLSVGGGSVYASRLAAALARAGHRVRLFTRLGPGQAMDEAVGGVAVRRCPWDRKRGFFDEIAALADSFAHYFADAVKLDGPYDVVHCHEWLTAMAGFKAMAINPCRLAISFHSTEWTRTGAWPDSGDSARISGVERAVIEAADAVAAASYWVRRKLDEQFHPPDWKCGVVHHGADLPFPNPDAMPAEAERVRAEAGIRPGRPSLMFAGRFSLQSGGDVAARACRLAGERFPDARFLFIGSGPLEEEMRRAAGPAAVFFPLRGRLVPPEYYQAVDMVLAPFRRDTNGRAIMPAWSAAKPVAVLEDAVPSEFVMTGANGWILPDDPARLADVIAGAFADPAHTAWMGRNGRTAAATAFTWDESAKRLLGLYGRAGRLAANVGGQRPPGGGVP